MANTGEHQHFLKVEEGWPVIQEGVDKVIKIIEGDKSQSFSSEDYMRFYTLIRSAKEKTLIKNVLAIYVDVGKYSMKYYEKDFEEAMFKDTAAFDTRKASNWIKNESYKNYILKVECCLKHERDSVSCYLQNKSQNKLLEIVEYELLSVYATELQEKKQPDATPLTDKSI